MGWGRGREGTFLLHEQQSRKREYSAVFSEDWICRSYIRSFSWSKVGKAVYLAGCHVRSQKVFSARKRLFRKLVGNIYAIPQWWKELPTTIRQDIYSIMVSFHGMKSLFILFMIESLHCIGLELLRILTSLQIVPKNIKIVCNEKYFRGWRHSFENNLLFLNDISPLKAFSYRTLNPLKVCAVAIPLLFGTICNLSKEKVRNVALYKLYRLDQRNVGALLK